MFTTKPHVHELDSGGMVDIDITNISEKLIKWLLSIVLLYYHVDGIIITQPH